MAAKQTRSACLVLGCADLAPFDLCKRHRNMRSYFKTQYGVDFWEMMTLLEDQKGCCAICQVRPGPLDRRIVLDHNHITGDAREWLCSNCNTALGMFGDSIEKLIAAADYLRKHQT